MPGVWRQALLPCASGSAGHRPVTPLTATPIVWRGSAAALGPFLLRSAPRFACAAPSPRNPRGRCLSLSLRLTQPTMQPWCLCCACPVMRQLPPGAPEETQWIPVPSLCPAASRHQLSLHLLGLVDRAATQNPVPNMPGVARLPMCDPLTPCPAPRGCCSVRTVVNHPQCADLGAAPENTLLAQPPVATAHQDWLHNAPLFPAASFDPTAS